MIQTMNLIDEEDVELFEACENGRKIGLALDHGPGGRLEVHAHFIGEDTGQGGLPEAGGAA